MKQTKKEIIKISIQTVLLLSGYVLLFTYNWKIAVGVFLIHWSINHDIN